MAHVFSPGSEPIPGYRLVKLLGMGGFGEVWKATGPGGIEVALKIVSLETRQGFKEFSAIRMIKDIRHAGLNQIFALWLKDRDGHVFMEGLDDSANWKGKGGELIIGMGLCDKNLLDRLHELQDEGQAGIPAEELLNYMEDAARAIDYLNTPVHNLPSGLAAIQHCNIKPQNLMLAGVSVQVSDFGLARVLGDARVTQTSMSAPYTAPEMITANQPSASSDQYSLAITYVELRTGALPFENPTPAGMLFAHVQGQLDLSRLPPAEREVIRRATALEPEARYPSTLDMVRALRRACFGDKLKAAASSGGHNSVIRAGLAFICLGLSLAFLQFYWLGEDSRAAELLAVWGYVLTTFGLLLVSGVWARWFFFSYLVFENAEPLEKWMGRIKNLPTTPNDHPDPRLAALESLEKDYPVPDRDGPRFIEAAVPYAVGKPVQGDLFVGRRDILIMVQNNLSPEAGKNILVLRGQRRTGKTSVLLRLRDTLTRESYGFYLPVFIDVQGLTLVQNEGQFLYILAHHIWSGLKSQDVEVPKPAPQEFEQTPLMAFELAFLENIKGALGHRQILLMLDEFEMLKGLIERGQVSDKILDYFRHLMQHSPLLFLIAGTQTLRELTGGYWSVFFNLAVVIDIGTLDEAAARWLITEPVRLWYTVEPPAIQEIVRVAGCHPYFTQLVCKQLLEVRNEQKLNRVGLAQVRKAVDRTLECGDEQIGYPWSEGDCSRAERLVLSALAGELGEMGKGVARDVLAARLHDDCIGPEVAIGPTIDRLRIRGVLQEADAEGLSFVVPLFQIWLIRKRYDTLEAARQYNREHAPA